jgi:hypothetical protein
MTLSVCIADPEAVIARSVSDEAIQPALAASGLLRLRLAMTLSACTAELEAVIARSVSDEAIQSALAGLAALDCFASLAMTVAAFR